MKETYLILCLALLATWLVLPSEARGGRGRGGGSFGGLFGGWRSKYGSKSSSSGNGRRVVNGSPSQASMPRLPPPPPPPPAKSISLSKQQSASYPRQQLPPGYGYAPAAGQGMYYANAQTLPAGAVYYAQPPSSMSMGSGTGNFLGGMLAGHMMNSMLFGHRHHHVYHQNPQGEPVASGVGGGRDVIIINNGQAAGETETNQPLNESVLPEDAVQSSEDPLDSDDEDQASSYSEEEQTAATAPPQPPAGGIICFPIMLNETDSQNPELVQEVERVVCFPAPSPAPATPNSLCQHDPQCLLEQGGSTTSTVPPIVAGDIGAATETPSLETTSSSTADADVVLE